MKPECIYIIGVLFCCVQCFDSESFEYNGLEEKPLYETIIYSDIADIINEFDHNNDAFDKANNESESNEEIEDLLSEYHHYLEKAHKQRVNYLEKNKPKNKVPMIRHEKFTKLKSPGPSKYNEYYKNSLFKTEHKFPQVLNPFSMFIPFNSNKFLTTEPPYNNDLSAFSKIIFNDQNALNTGIPVKSSCCKDGRASCKQCFSSLDHTQRNNPIIPFDEEKIYNLNNPMSPDRLDDIINIRIKVDVQLPKLQQDRVQFYSPQSRDKMSEYDSGVSKEYLSAIKLPSPYFNVPIPMNLFGYKKMINKNTKHEILNPPHKLAVHKKKKSKIGSTNKKHRKKVITFHNIKIEPELSFAMFNISINSKNKTDYNDTVIANLPYNKTVNDDAYLPISTTTPVENLNINENQTEENVLLLVNITNNIDNGTNESNRTENSIEIDYTNSISNTTTEKSLHLIRKREISSQSKSSTFKSKTNTPEVKDASKHATSAIKINTNKNKSKKKFSKKNTATKLMVHKAAKNISIHKPEKSKSNNKKIDKNLPTDLELLYWPNTNINKSNEIVKNITAIILEHENRKSKLNMSADGLRRNRTKLLEQAVFGDVDWNDVDTVAPAFISFVGKYIEGILTFCNDRICHSMKCTKQNCIHRFCVPKDRFNKGHCTGSNFTDSVASMASIMDLPSNVAFEIVDILEDRMIGKLYGKITLCMSAKCITFIASKKVFHKYKCSNTEIAKELDSKGHCKHEKIV